MYVIWVYRKHFHLAARKECVKHLDVDKIKNTYSNLSQDNSLYSILLILPHTCAFVILFGTKVCGPVRNFCISALYGNMNTRHR
jgi:hypothetical protein